MEGKICKLSDFIINDNTNFPFTIQDQEKKECAEGRKYES